MGEPEIQGSGDARGRLIEAMAAVVAEKGFPAVTIADIVARARVSRRTFYEQFADKEECLVACYRVLGERMLDVVGSVPVDGLGAREHVAAVVDALIAALTASPDLTHTYFLSTQAAGARARAARQEVQAGLVRLFQRVATDHGAGNRRVVVPSDMMATAVVGGIGELIAQTLERGRADQLTEIAPTVSRLMSAVLLAPADA